MSAKPTTPTVARFVRKPLSATAPDRRAGGFYRTAQSTDNEAIGGIPLVSTEAVLTAVVRTGYRVVGAQVDRSAEWARRLRSSGDQAVGPNSDRRAVDAIERLVFKSALSGLEWLEGVTAEPGSPLRRLAATEYQWLGSLIGLGDPSAGRHAGPGKAAKKSTVAAGPGAKPGTSQAGLPRLRIKHTGARRAVVVRRWDCDPIDSGNPISLVFVARDDPTQQLPGTLTAPLQGNAALLSLDIALAAPSGIWSAAICERSGEQLGMIEIRF